MKPIAKLTKEDIKEIKLITFDVDGVTVKKGTEITEKETADESTLIVRTHKLTDEVRDKLVELKKYFYISISSGRSSLYLTQVFQELLWTNVAFVSEIGIFVLANGELVQTEKFDIKTLQKMKDILIDLQKLENNDLFRAFEPKQFLITLHAWGEMKEVYDVVKKHDPEGEFYCWWNGEAFDIAPKRLNKGTALKTLAEHLGFSVEQTMAIGNGPNDKDMLDMAGIGVTTEPTVIESDFNTTGKEYLGGLELIDKLLVLQGVAPYSK